METYEKMNPSKVRREVAKIRKPIIERENRLNEIKRLKEIKKFENETMREKKELNDLRNSTGTRGKIIGGLKNGLSSIKNHLASVQKRNNTPKGFRTKNLLNDGSNQRINTDIRGMDGAGMHQVGNGSSLVNQNVGSGKGGVMSGFGNKKNKRIF